MQPGLPPAVRRVRGYFAPVNRQTGTPTAFDASAAASFDPDAPPAPWIDLGWISGFARASETKLQTIEGGAPGTVLLPEKWSDEDEERLRATTPLQRTGSPDDVSRTVLFILESDYLTGETIIVDGGRHVRA